MKWDDYEIFPKRRSMIPPFELNNEGGKGYALVLRYAGCNLRCPLCYAWKYAWFPKRNKHGMVIKETKVHVLNTLERLYSIELKKKINWIRIQGGEPCLSFDRTLFTLKVCGKALQIVHEVGLNKYQHTRAIIQTNGVIFSSLSEKIIQIIRRELERILRSLPKGRIIFEFSFKDPTGNRRWNYKSLLRVQVKGFNTILNRIFKPLWDEGFENTAIYMVAGLGPSIDLHNISIVPIDPFSLPDEYPLFHPRTWSQEFKLLYREFTTNIVTQFKAYREFRSNPKTNQGKRIPLEEFEPTRFQVAWIKGYAGEYQSYGLKIGIDLPNISKILRRISNRDLLDKQWLGICKGREGRIIKEWLEVLRRIPCTNNPSKLKELIEEMNKWFYPSHPKGHYPYL